MIQITTDFSSETKEARSQNNNFKMLKEKLRILYPAKTSYTNGGKRKTFSDNGKLRESVATTRAL